MDMLEISHWYLDELSWLGERKHEHHETRQRSPSKVNAVWNEVCNDLATQAGDVPPGEFLTEPPVCLNGLTWSDWSDV